jgi:hypothetical protein
VIRKYSIRSEIRREFGYLSFTKTRWPICVEIFLRDVALFLPFGCNKDRQTAASGGTKRRSEIGGFYGDEARSGNVQQTAAQSG